MYLDRLKNPPPVLDSVPDGYYIIQWSFGSHVVTNIADVRQNKMWFPGHADPYSVKEMSVVKAVKLDLREMVNAEG